MGLTIPLTVSSTTCRLLAATQPSCLSPLVSLARDLGHRNAMQAIPADNVWNSWSFSRNTFTAASRLSEGNVSNSSETWSLRSLDVTQPAAGAGVRMLSLPWAGPSSTGQSADLALGVWL